jgi:hypothetical protein
VGEGGPGIAWPTLPLRAVPAFAGRSPAGEAPTVTEPAEVTTPGELKQLILRTYNATNQQVWGTGVQQQRVELLEDRILVVAVHQRSPALAALDASRRDLTRQLDVALVDLYKELLKPQLERLLGVGG